jgi:hypothetical protein
MHGGSLGTLEEVVVFYNKGGTPNQWLSKEIRPLNLTAEEQKDLVVFMEALTGQKRAAEESKNVIIFLCVGSGCFADLGGSAGAKGFSEALARGAICGNRSNQPRVFSQSQSRGTYLLFFHFLNG